MAEARAFEYPDPRRHESAGAFALADDLEALIRALLPVGPGGRLALVGDVDQRLARRWLTDTDAIPSDVRDWIAVQAAALSTTDPTAEIEAVVARLRGAGFDDIVIGSHIAAALQRLQND